MKMRLCYPAILGRAIRNRRCGLGVHQADIAAVLNVSQPAYSRIEKGSTSITVYQLRLIAGHLRTTSSELLSLSDKWSEALEISKVEITEDKDTSDLFALATLRKVIENVSIGNALSYRDKWQEYMKGE